MASIGIEGWSEAAPAAEPWPLDDDVSVRADEMLVRQLDTGFAGEVRKLLHDPAAELAGESAEDALGGISEALPMLGGLRDRYLAQALGPQQRSMLEHCSMHASTWQSARSAASQSARRANSTIASWPSG